MIGHYPHVFNFNRFFLKLSQSVTVLFCLVSVGHTDSQQPTLFYFSYSLKWSIVVLRVKIFSVGSSFAYWNENSSFRSIVIIMQLSLIKHVHLQEILEKSKTTNTDDHKLKHSSGQPNKLTFFIYQRPNFTSAI